MKKILVIGGGFAGSYIAKKLEKKFDVTLVDTKDYFEFTPGILRTIVEPEHIKKIQILHSHYLKKTKILIGNVKEVNKDYIKIINTDLAFWCTGIKPNFEFMLKNFKESLNLQNQVIVNEYLQVIGQKNIFAAGDLTDRKEEKTAQNAKRQARIVIKNIISLYKNKKLHSYIIKETPKIISLGKYDGIFIFKNFVFGGLIAGIMKNLVEKKEMFFYRF